MRRIVCLLGIAQVLLPLAAARAGEPVEYQLAVVDAGRYLPHNDITVARFRSLLPQLDGKFTENAATIADITVKAQKILREAGIQEKMLKMMEGINRLFAQPFPNQRYAEYVSVYVATRIRGASHDEALAGIRDVLDLAQVP